MKKAEGKKLVKNGQKLTGFIYQEDCARRI